MGLTMLCLCANSLNACSFCAVIVLTLPLLALANDGTHTHDNSASEAYIDNKIHFAESKLSMLFTSRASLTRTSESRNLEARESQSSTPSNASSSTPTAAAAIETSGAAISLGAKIALGVGIPIFILATLGIGFYFMRRYWQRKLERYKRNDPETSDTVVILPGGVPSRPNTSHTTAPSMSASIKTASDIRALGGEIPDLPTYFSGDMIASVGVLDSYSDPGWNLYHKTEKKDYEMHTYAIEIGDSTPGDEEFPINAHVVEMDAHEPRAINEGIFELGLPSPRLPLEIEQDTVMVFSEQDNVKVISAQETVKVLSEPESDPKRAPVSESTNDLSTLPSQRHGFQLLKTPTATFDDEDIQGETEFNVKGIIKLENSCHGQEFSSNLKEPFTIPSEVNTSHDLLIDESKGNTGEDDKIFNPNAVDGVISIIEPAIPSPEKHRGRSQKRTPSSKSPSSIPRSQFSRSSSTPRALPSLDNEIMPLPAAVQKRTARSMSRGKTHISTMIADTRPNVPVPVQAYGLPPH